MKNLLKFILVSLLIGGIIIIITAAISFSNDISDEDYTEDFINTNTMNEEDNSISTKEVFILGRNNNDSLDDDVIDINLEK
ncbi:hypothetical protein [Anaerosinus gibii]|uniref:Uncharacterized protein n=1 Tax=Selenobaculum gibii TaxID=3054208 RepID=A0A9Y2AJ84_9FIRM|nr:hypothetical protein [Selenobaculum gbiensis]WIW70821.1 hypothetical protein P3F81_00405 [Selenobaculum gbiensis]